MTEPSKQDEKPATKVAKPPQRPPQQQKVVREADSTAEFETTEKAVEEDNPQGHPRFVSTSGEPVMIALTRGGHSASVATRAQNPKGTPLDPRFHKAALMKGCVPVGMADRYAMDDYEDMAMNVAADRAELVRKAIADMVTIAADDIKIANDYFDDSGRPRANEITRRVGFNVNATERDKVWDEYSQYSTNADD